MLHKHRLVGPDLPQTFLILMPGCLGVKEVSTQTRFLVRTSMIFGADVHDPKGCQKTLRNKNNCVDFLVPSFVCLVYLQGEVSLMFMRVLLSYFQEDQGEEGLQGGGSKLEGDGDRSSRSSDPLLQKGIVAESGGTIEMFGERPYPTWTRLVLGGPPSYDLRSN